MSDAQKNGVFVVGLCCIVWGAWNAANVQGGTGFQAAPGTDLVAVLGPLLSGVAATIWGWIKKGDGIKRITDVVAPVITDRGGSVVSRIISEMTSVLGEETGGTATDALLMVLNGVCISRGDTTKGPALISGLATHLRTWKPEDNKPIDHLADVEKLVDALVPRLLERLKAQAT